MNRYKIGIAPINWSNDDDLSLGGDISFEQCISEMKEAGFSGTEVGNKFPDCPHELKAKLKPLQLEVSSAWFSSHFTDKNQFESTLERFLDHLSFLNEMGARFVNVGECAHAIHGLKVPIFDENKPVYTKRQWTLLIQGLHILGRLCHDYGMVLVFHHHLGTGVQTQDEIDFLLEHTSPELVSLLLDTGHAMAADICPVDLFKRHCDRIKYIHLKDIRSKVFNHAKQKKLSFLEAVKKGVFTVPGDGDLNFIPLFDELDVCNYHGWMIVEAEQDPALAHPKVYAKKARHYLKQTLGV
jgi:inosose dehydratase